jgi:hypothetical protein
MISAIKNYFHKTDPVWQTFKQEAERKMLFTKDWAELSQYERLKVFVYNEVQRGQIKHNLLGTNPVYGGLCYTESSDYVLYKKMLGKETFPFALEISEDQKHGMSSLIGDPGQIMGEMYSLTPLEIKKLDDYLLNGVYFNRKKVKVLIPYKVDSSKDEFSVCTVEAFMWVGDASFWTDQISSSEAKNLFKRSLRLFAAKDNKEETLGAYYVFDHNVEATEK